MTKLNPTFTFNEKTCELSREGKAVVLPHLYAQMFSYAANRDGPVSAPAMIAFCGVKLSTQGIANEVRRLNRRLAKLGLSFESSNRGYVIAVRDIPKWQPSIPPVNDDPALMKMPI